MNTLVFTTYNIDPEHWTDFAHTAAVELSPSDAAARQSPLIPYILVSSASATANYDNRPPTAHLASPVESELATYDRRALQTLFKALVDREENHTLLPDVFVVLDAASAADRRAWVVMRDLECVDAETGELTEGMPGEEGVKERTVWRWFRLPFERVWKNVAVMTAKGRMADEGGEFAVEEIREE